MGPQNVPISDTNFGTDLPETDQSSQDLSAEINMAKFSKTKEFKKLKEVIEARIVFHQQYMPGGRGETIAFRDLNNEERGYRCLAADLVIAELRSLISAYEEAEQIIKQANV